jgi:cytochrome oxidase Cu insertion factor (SCO1/SenC/PrrC family)
VIAALLFAASIHIVDDAGRTRSVEEWRGTPTVVVPMYTRCPLACPMIAENLKRAALNMNVDSIRIVFFSIDPRDTPESMHSFREQHRLPLAWTMATATAGDTRQFMESIGYRFSDTLTHPNLIVVLSRDLRSATTLTASDIASALNVARGGNDWLGRFGPFALAIVMLVCTLSAIALVILVLR